MATYGQTKLNKSEVRNATFKFILSFIILTVMSLTVIYFFFKSSQMQNREIKTEIDHYKNLISRNELIRVKTDSIYYKMSLLNSDKVQNDIFLRNSIMQDIRDTQNVMGSDSAKGFRHYASFVKDLQKIMLFKNDLIGITAKERAAKRNVDECMGKINSVSTQLQVNPIKGRFGKN